MNAAAKPAKITPIAALIVCSVFNCEAPETGATTFVTLDAFAARTAAGFLVTFVARDVELIDTFLVADFFAVFVLPLVVVFLVAMIATIHDRLLL